MPKFSLVFFDGVFFFLLEGVTTLYLVGPSVAYIADVLLDLGGMALGFC